MNRPRLILADEPTRGVSIGSKIEIYKAIRELAESGVSILLASSEFDELVGLCNRIYLIDRGRTVGRGEQFRTNKPRASQPRPVGIGAKVGGFLTHGFNTGVTECID